MAARKRPSAEARLEHEYAYRAERVHHIAAVLNSLIRWGALVAIVFLGYRAIVVLAGQTTIADIGIGVKLLSNVRVSTAAAWLFGGGCLFYGERQARLRKDTVERQSRRITELEQSVDPKRTSSRLTARGDTNPEDRV